ncbi:uncharacterized protein LOC114794758 [Denticeps clupeoides]|uniref:Methyltransferase type 11 domain-containing protein n=1 Tax=Denticeps clupeoides TaxID=299321 RepID=A0AAY3ZYZ2_9TELE|nr:uncharacterized protein LOC114794758 [Denticeps clupeoides]
MNCSDARKEILRIVSQVEPRELPSLLEWLKHSDDLDDCIHDNNKVILKSIADDLRSCLPLEAVLSSESLTIQKTMQNPRPTVHVDAFLYDDKAVDALCEEGKMSSNYCLGCGSHSTAPLDFISHSFSIPELQFIFQQVLPDLTGRLVVDVGSRLGAVLYGGYLYSSAARLVGVEISTEFVHLQNMAVEKYGFSDRIEVIHADICSQVSLLQETDVLIMNNVFEYFLHPSDQIKAWDCIRQHFRKREALLLTVPSIRDSLTKLKINNVVDISGWVEEVCLNYDKYRKCDPDSLKEIHLYRVL